MSKVLFLSVPSHGNVNPTLGLVSELVKQGEEVVYFSSIDFKDKIEQAGAMFKSYTEDLDIFKMKKEKTSGILEPMHRVISSANKTIADILFQTKDLQFDYLIHSAAFPFTKVIADILKVPTVSSLAIFAGLKSFSERSKKANTEAFQGKDELMQVYKNMAQKINETYSVQMPENLMSLLFNKGDINLIYTSEYFIPASDRADFDDSYKFVGPPIFERKEDLDFPFEQLEGKKVIYISLGTVFSNYSLGLYDIFFKSFADLDAVIVMAAYNVDLSQLEIPSNFIVRNYVPQSAVLKYTDAAITHAGMNSMSDLVYNNIPFVAIPIGADQPVLAKRAEELGAAITLDVNDLNPELVRASIEKVLSDPAYLENIQKIGTSFKEAGGYPKAVEEIFKLKKEKGIH